MSFFSSPKCEPDSESNDPLPNHRHQLYSLLGLWPLGQTHQSRSLGKTMNKRISRDFRTRLACTVGVLPAQCRLLQMARLFPDFFAVAFVGRNYNHGLNRCGLLNCLRQIHCSHEVCFKCLNYISKRPSDDGYS